MRLATITNTENLLFTQWHALQVVMGNHSRTTGKAVLQDMIIPQMKDSKTRIQSYPKQISCQLHP